MRAIFLTNEVAELVPKMTTARMVVAAAGLGIETWVAELGALGIDERGEAILRACPAPTTLDALPALSKAARRPLTIETSDVVFVRLNPARFGEPWQIDFTLWMLRLLARRGVTAVNSGESLERTATKAFLSELPAELRPAQAVTADVEDALRAIARLGPEVVLKPARGTRGIGVVLLDARNTSPRPLVELLLERGVVVIQERLVSEDGADKRVVMVDGRPLEVDGRTVAIRRVPAPGEFRSNLHAGAKSELCSLSNEENALLSALGPHLSKAGLRVAGVDILAGKILEINVWAPGGLGPFAELTGIDASTPLLAALLSKAQEARPTG